MDTTQKQVPLYVAKFEQAVRADIAACEARGERYDPAGVSADDTTSTASDNLRTNPARRFTQKIQAAERRQLLHAERLAQNSYHRNNAIDFEREHYCALSLV